MRRLFHIPEASFALPNSPRRSGSSPQTDRTFPQSRSLLLRQPLGHNCWRARRSRLKTRRRWKAIRILWRRNSTDTGTHDSVRERLTSEVTERPEKTDAKSRDVNDVRNVAKSSLHRRDRRPGQFTDLKLEEPLCRRLPVPGQYGGHGDNNHERGAIN